MKIQKSQCLTVLAFLLWSPIPWLYLNPPEILAGQPLAVYVVFLSFSGLSCAATALLISLRARISERAARFYVFFFILAFVGAYQFSGLAPSWQCFGKRLEAAVGRAAGQTCTTTCTDNDTKPCSGWSSCWDKFVSCSSAGKDQDGRNCNGCCFSCDVVCEEEEPPPPSYQPPTVSGTVCECAMGATCAAVAVWFISVPCTLRCTVLLLKKQRQSKRSHTCSAGKEDRFYSKSGARLSAAGTAPCRT